MEIALDTTGAPPTAPVSAEELNLLARVLTHRTLHVALATVSELGDHFWICAGALRNNLWNHLHNVAPTLDTEDTDVDVIYFDGQDLSQAAERRFQAHLDEVHPGPQWSVKNQARMARKHGFEAHGVADTVARFPETATSIAARLDTDDRLHIIAPHGLADLMAMTLRPTPAFQTRRALLEQRAQSKGWFERWPRLRWAWSPDADA